MQHVGVLLFLEEPTLTTVMDEGISSTNVIAQSFQLQPTVIVLIRLSDASGSTLCLTK